LAKQFLFDDLIHIPVRFFLLKNSEVQNDKKHKYFLKKSDNIYMAKLRKILLNQIARLLTGEHGSVIPGLSSVIVNQFGQ
jgi:hypothetical protein